MNTIHTEEELIITLKKKELLKFYKFLNQIKPADAESQEDMECLIGHPFAHQSQKEHFGVHRIENEDRSKFTVVKEKENWYVFLKKNKQVDKLRDLFFKHVPFPDAKR